MEGMPRTLTLRLLCAPYFLLALGQGMFFLFSDPVRYSHALYDVARYWAPMSTWGIAFIVGALIIALVGGIGEAKWISYGLLSGGFFYTFWCLLLGLGSVHSPEAGATFVAPLLYLFIAYQNFAESVRTRLYDEGRQLRVKVPRVPR